MTTALRAAFRNKDRKGPPLGPAFRKKINSKHKVDSIIEKGLKIQSFFSGLVEGLAGMESILADMNPHRDEAGRTEYDRVTGLIHGVEQAFWNAGYSNKGNPYWADSNGPSDRQIGDIIAAATACLPVFHERSRIFLKNIGKSPRDQKAFNEFIQCFDKFHNSIIGFNDYFSYQQYVRDWAIEGGAAPMCALA